MTRVNSKWKMSLIFFFLTLFASIDVADAFFLPDTGQTKCYSVKGPLKVITCPSPGNAAAQDGSYTINSPSYSTISNGTIKDNNTGLTWQQQDDGIVRMWDDAVRYCDNLTLDGFADWRFPTEKELISIMDYGSYNPSIDPIVFPNTEPSLYWSSTTTVDNVDKAWAALFNFGYTDNYYSKLDTFLVRCVRGSYLTFGDFIDNHNSTVTERSAGLMWQQAEAGLMNWASALSYCENLLLGGYTDWRLPNIKELASLSDESKYNPAIDSIFFPSAHTSYYWSSTTCQSGAGFAFATNFLNGIIDGNGKSNSHYVRCVRGEKTPSNDGELMVHPQKISFGIVSIGSSSSQDLTITNLGTGPMDIGQITGPSLPFSILSDSCSGRTISSGKSCSVIISFSPTLKGAFADKLSIVTSDAEHPVVDITLAGNTNFLLPDTGYTACYDSNGNLVECPPPGDPSARDGSYIINPPSYTVNFDGTVTDNNTSFMWQQDDNGQYDNWYKASGTYHKRYNKNTSDICGNLTLAGYTDWRLPNPKELESIVNYGTPFIDRAAFLNTHPACYWTSATDAAYPTSAWIVSFGSGQITGNSKENNCYIRCVRRDFSFNTFVNNNNWTITNAALGLMWMQYPANVDEGKGSAYCEGLNYAGFSDWRLPNIRELASLTDLTRTNPPLNTSFFPQSYSEYNHAYFWSSTGSWFIDLIANGRTENYIDNNTRLACALGGGMGTYNCGSFARCVRNVTSEPKPGVLTGTVTDSSNGIPISSVAVTVTDSAKISTTTTGADGKYIMTNIIPGSFTATFEKPGYFSQTMTGSLTAGQTLTMDVQLTRIPPLTINITSPQDGAVVNTSTITVTGNVSNNAQVIVDGIQASVAGNTFSASINLIEGQNNITAFAQDQYGQTASHGITVRFTTRGTIIGMVTDSSTGIPIVSATVSVTDSLNNTQTAFTGIDGRYAITVVAAGDFSGSIMKDGYNTYNFSGTMSPDQTITVDEAITKSVTATTIGDYGNVTVMEVAGSYNAKKPDGSLNATPRQEIAKEFLRTHQDQYDFIVIYSNFDFSMPDENAKGFYLEVKNDVQGLGKPIFDNSSLFGSNGKLQGTIDMGNVSKLITNPADPKFEETINTLAHEQMHRWEANAKFKDANHNISTDLLGKDGCHWSFLLDTDGSMLYGNDWQDNKDGTFTSLSANKYYSHLDLYLMGMYDKSQVPPMLLIDNQSIDPTKLPEIGATVSGTARYITMDDIIAAEGPRIPDASTSQKVFKTAFLLITRPGTLNGNELPGIENIRNAWAGRFSALTGGKGSIADVAPTLAISVSCPSDGDAISRHDATVKGAIINSTGNETGVTVNGIVATVTCNQFIANHVPLVEGQNTMTATAIDAAGNAATTSITVSAVGKGDYIRVTSNIESGIAPLETTLRIDGSFSITNSNLNITGPIQPEIVSSSPDEYRIKMVIEGTYYFTASAIGPDGIVYQDTIVITVMNKTQLDNLLKAKWEAMNTALANQDIEKASTYYSEETKQIYNDLFNALHAYLPQIAQEMQEIQFIYLKNNTAKYRMRQNEFYGGKNIILTYYIYFVIDKDGVWKIYRY